MKIKIYILTYRNAPDLNSGLEYLFNSDAPRDTKHTLELNVINNHTNFSIETKYSNFVNVIHNTLQPDFGTGHNSRNWNQALIHGFKSLTNPDCDLVITAHDDTWWGKNWLNLVINGLDQGFNYQAYGLGDNIQVWTPEAVKRIGLWDERFCILAHAEYDYFVRAALYNAPHSSVNDIWHGRQKDGQHFMHYAWNVLPCGDGVLQRPPQNAERHAQANQRISTMFMGREMFYHKWGVIPESTGITEIVDHIKTPKVPSYMFYPYFERDVETLTDQNYMWTEPYDLYVLPYPDMNGRVYNAGY